MAEEHAPELQATLGRDVFISYASHDKAVADTVCKALENAGLACWIAPRDVVPGETFAGAIVRAIDATKAIVLILSEHSADSQHVLREVERASSKRHPLIALRIDLAPMPADLEYFLNTSQWLDASTAGVKRALPRLVDSVRSALASSSSASGIAASPAAAAGVTRRPTRWLIASVAVAVAALGYVLVDKSWLSKRGDVQRPSAMATSTSTANPTEGLPVSDKSVAVLPFVDMSEKHDQEYFSDGLTEELIDRIASAPGLKVIARTSSFQFKGKNEDVRGIAQKLGVANLLEGSVRKSGQSIRVTAQLIRAADGIHRWSHSYDEQVSNIFKVQGVIAEKVARELESELVTGSTAVSRTKNLQAYEAVQKGRYFWVRSEVGDEDKALAYFLEATRVDPNYAYAWSRLATLYFMKGYETELAVTDARTKALSAVQRALALDPNLAAAHDTLGAIYQNFDWNWRAAKEEYETAARLDPNGGYAANAGYLNWMLTGDISSEIDSLRKDLIRDPIDTGSLWSLGLSYWAAQRYTESAKTFERLLELDPHYSGAPSLYAQVLANMGQNEKALATALSDTDKSSQWGILPCIYWKLGRRMESTAALKELLRDAAKSSYDLARMSACRGETDDAFVWLERAFRERQVGLANVKFDPFFLSLHLDPRFQSLLVKMNLADEGSSR